MKRHVLRWLAEPEVSGPGSFAEMRDRIRDMNQETSQEVFVGPYLPAELRDEFSMHYRNMTDGFLSLPLPLPGTAVWRGMQSRKAVIRILSTCAAQAKKRLAAGGKPECLLDFWVEYLATEGASCIKTHLTNESIADVVMDFLFASQDASTASLTWLAALLCDHPEVAAQVRAEVAAVRPDMGAANAAPLDGDTLYKMVYTRQVVKETLRYRPVAPMVPQVAAQEFPLADGVVAPKGSLVIPSLMAPVYNGSFPNGDQFDPDRMSAEREEDKVYGKHMLTFGCGPHACVGITYATNHLVAFAARLAASVDMTRRKNADSDKFLYLCVGWRGAAACYRSVSLLPPLPRPTVYPRNCEIHMQPAAGTK